MPKILGVSVNSITLVQAVNQVEQWLKTAKKHYIVTPNPEMIMLAQTDQEFRRILNQADLAIPDGWGLRLAAPGLTRVTGRELMLALIKKGYKVYLGGGKPGEPGPDIKKINKMRLDLLFVGMGMGKQEKWIAKNLPKLNVKVAMGVGGALDQIAKPWLVAPKWLQNLGFEWLYRLILQPWRLRRQWQLVRFLAKIYL